MSAPAIRGRETTERVPTSADSQSVAILQRADEVARDLIDNSIAANTRIAYQNDWARFTDWCMQHDLDALPATVETVKRYLSEASELRRAHGGYRYQPATLTRWSSTISSAHRMQGMPPPGDSETIKKLLVGLRGKRKQPQRRVEPIELDLLRTMLQAMPQTVRHRREEFGYDVAQRRDSCMLLFGVGAALRRSELAGLDIEQVRLRRGEGVRITLGRTKGNQEADGEVVAIPFGTSHLTCAPCAYVRWRETLDSFLDYTAVDHGRTEYWSPPRTSFEHHVCAAPRLGPAEGPLFRALNRAGELTTAPIGGAAVAAMIKRRVAAAGLDPAEYSGHSMRAGFVTQAVRNGADVQAIMKQTRHKTPAMVAVYARLHTPLVGNAVVGWGL